MDKSIRKTKIISTAKLKNIRISPYKIRKTLDVIRGLNLEKAIFFLSNKIGKSHSPLKDLLKSAFSNYIQKDSISLDKVFLTECFADGGSIIKRGHPVSKGHMHLLRCRTSHITIKLGVKDGQ